MQRLRTVTLLDVSAVAGHHAMPAALLFFLFIFFLLLIEIMYILKAIKSHLKGSYDTQKLMLVVISYEIYETRRRLVS